MYSPQSAEKISEAVTDGPAEPPTEATHATRSTSRIPSQPTAHHNPTRFEVADMRFNETAPPVISPTSSSPRAPAASAMASPTTSGNPATGVGSPVSSQGTSGALSRNDHILNRGRQIPYSTLNDVSDQRQYAMAQPVDDHRYHHQSSQQPQRRQHSQLRGEDYGSAKEKGRPRSGKQQLASSQNTRRRSPRHKKSSSAPRDPYTGQSQHRKRLHRPLAAAPKFGHPFASNPDLSRLEGSSAGQAMPYVDWGDHALKSSTPTKEAAVAPAAGAASSFPSPPPAAAAAAAYGPTNNVSSSKHLHSSLSLSAGLGAGAGAPGDPRVSSGYPPRPSSERNDAEIIVGTSPAVPPSAAGDYRQLDTGVAPSPTKGSSGLQKTTVILVTSGILDDEGALFPLQASNRHVHYNGRGGAPRGDMSLSSSLHPQGSGRGGNGERGDHHAVHHRGHHRNTTASNEDGNNNYNNNNGMYSSDEASVDSAGTQITRDSFGYPIYHPIFRHGAFGEFETMEKGNGGHPGGAPRASIAGGPAAAGAGGGAGGPPGAPGSTLQVPTTTDVPWDLRNIAEKEVSKTFAFLSTRYFWFLVEYALRVTCIAMMIPAIIINLDLKYTPFVSTTFALTSVVIAVGTNFGQSCVFFVQYVKGGCIWLPLATICSALKLNRYLGAWFVVYVVLLFLMAMFTEQTTRRMCLLLYNISMVSLLSGDESLVFPTRVLADWALGAAFALVATLIPYPMLATRFSAHITKIMFNNTATCFTGILSCFWAPSNTERSMSMVRIRSLVRTLDHLIEKFDAYDAYTFYEVLIYETSERREVRKEKVKLLLKLKMNLRAMERVINMVQERPQMIDLSERCLLLRDHLSVPMDDISRSMEALLWKLSEAKKYEQLRTLSGYFEATGRSIKRLQTEFDVGRRVLFYEHQEATALREGRMEEFVPLMTFFVFSIVNFWTTLEEFETFIDRHKPMNDWKETFKMVFNALIGPFRDNAELVRLLCVRRAEPEVRVVIEAAKVSVAMLISVIFFYYVDNQSLLLTGPSIIAFVSGTNPVEAVQAGAARMSGTLIGAVLGFFAASLCHTAVDRVAALCVITFVMTFFRPGQKFGVICMYCNFVAVSSLAPTEQTADLTISRIQQNTFAIFIYCFISVAIFPVSPNHVLFKKRMVVMQNLNTTLQKLSSLFNEAARSYTETRGEILRGAKTEDDVVNISRPGTVDGDWTARTMGDPGMQMPPAHHNSNSNNNNSSVLIKLKGMNDDEAEVRSTLSNANMLMPGAFTMAPQDTMVERIFTDIFTMMDTMKATSSVMPLAADEFQIIPHEYPLRASGDVHAALYRLCALVYTMTCAWKTMREKGYFTTDMLHILHNLAPIANDIARCIDRFTHVMEFYIRFPSSGLSSELTKGAMQFRALCVELSARKERDLIAVIRKTILMKRIRDDDSTESDEGRHTSNNNSGYGGGGGNGGQGGRDDDADNFGGGDSSNNNNNASTDNGNSGDYGDPNNNTRRRSHITERESRSSRKHRGRRRSANEHRQRNSSSGSRRRRGGNKNRRASPHHGQQQQQHRQNSQSPYTSRNDVAAMNERGYGRDGDHFNSSAGAVSQVRSAAPFFNSPAQPLSGSVNPPRQGDPAGAASGGADVISSDSTFKDSVMPRVDSRDEDRSRIPIPIPGDSSWLPVPRDELPPPPSQPGRDEDESVANTSPRSRMDGMGTVTNATRVFDPSVFPPPPPEGDEEINDDPAAAMMRRKRLEAQLPPSMKNDEYDDAPPRRPRSAPPTGGIAGDAPPVDDRSGSHGRSPQSPSLQAMTNGTSESSRRRPHSDLAQVRSHRSHRRSQLRNPQRLVAHEESPAVKKSSALLRADRLRDHLRGIQRQASTGAMARQHSSCEMRAFGASYTNIAAIDKSAVMTSHNPAHHRSEYQRHHSHHISPHPRGHGHSHSSLYYDEEEPQSVDGDPLHHGGSGGGGGGSGGRRHYGSPHGSNPNLESSLPYGSREGDLALLGSPTMPTSPQQQQQPQHVSTHEPASVTSNDRMTADGVFQQSHMPRRPEPAGMNHKSQDRITLHQTSSDSEDEGIGNHAEGAGRHRRGGAGGRDRRSENSDSVSASSDSYDSSSSYYYGSGRSEWGSGSSRDDDSSYDEDDDGASSSLVRFNDSFTTPITVQDAEGLHAFTLSLEMFGKELRRVLYGFEEMLQSL